MSVWFLGARGSPERSSHDQELGSRVPDVGEPSQGRELAESMGMVSLLRLLDTVPKLAFGKSDSNLGISQSLGIRVSADVIWVRISR